MTCTTSDVFAIMFWTSFAVLFVGFILFGAGYALGAVHREPPK